MDIISQYLYESCMKNTSDALQIQNYNLFGEAKGLPDVVHCESIAARSVLHNWEFAPHRHARLHQFLLIQKGGGKAELEGHTHNLSSSSVVNVPKGCIHAFAFQKNTHGWVITLGEEILTENLKDSEGLRTILSHAGVFKSTTQIRTLMKDISEEHASLDFARAHILRSMSGLLIGYISRIIAQSDAKATRTIQSDLQFNFEKLLDSNYLHHWSVSKYADALSVTPGHLSRIMRQSTGLSASANIDERIAREARRFLAYTNLTISEIAYALEFGDPAYFARVFSRATGMSPRAFRLSLENPAQP